MAKLSAAVEELQGAVDGVAQRLLPQIATLESANTQLREQLGEALADDEAAAAVLAESEAAVASIRSQVEELNSLGASPETPVEEVPAEEAPVEEPVEEPAVEVPGDAVSTPAEDPEATAPEVVQDPVAEAPVEAPSEPVASDQA